MFSFSPQISPLHVELSFLTFASHVMLEEGRILPNASYRRPGWSDIIEGASFRSKNSSVYMAAAGGSLCPETKSGHPLTSDAISIYDAPKFTGVPAGSELEQNLEQLQQSWDDNQGAENQLNKNAKNERSVSKRSNTSYKRSKNRSTKSKKRSERKISKKVTLEFNALMKCFSHPSYLYGHQKYRVVKNKRWKQKRGKYRKKKKPVEEVPAYDPKVPRIGIYTLAERRAKIEAWKKKRKNRVFGKLRYGCRKRLAESRPRYKGRFTKVDMKVIRDPNADPALVEAMKATLVYEQALHTARDQAEPNPLGRMSRMRNRLADIADRSDHSNYT